MAALLLALLAADAPFGGSDALRSEATGFFRVEHFGPDGGGGQRAGGDDDRRTGDKRAGKWLLVTPGGRGLFAMGANHVGRYLDEQADDAGLIARHGSREAAAAFLLRRMREIGLTAGEAYRPIAPELKELPWVANARFPFPSKFAFDVFDPAVRDKLRRSVLTQCEAWRGDPAVIGVAFADLPVWDGRRVAFYESLPADSPGGRALAESRAADETDEQFLGRVADWLYADLKAAVAEGSPGHLFLGERFVLRMVPDEVLRAVGRHVDLFCTQALILSPRRPPEWQTFQADGYRREHAIVGKPLVIVDWAAPFGTAGPLSTDRGELRGEERAAAEAAEWLLRAAEEPSVVGVFKCQLIGRHGNDRWFEGKAKRTYLRDDGTDFPARTALTREAHAAALEAAYAAAGAD